MSVCGERSVSHLSYQFSERRNFAEAGPDRNHVDEEPDHRFQFNAAAACDGGSYQNVVLARITPQQSVEAGHQCHKERRALDRKSTRLNSSHSQISYAVFCLKKKKKNKK